MVTNFRRVLKTTDAVAPEDGVFEVRVTSMGRVNAFVEDVVSHLVGSEKYAPSKEIRIMARGTAISKAVIVSEILSRRVPSLSQEVELGSSDVEDVFEPVGEHDDDTGNVTRVRIVPSLVITLKAIEEIKPEDIKEHHFIKRPMLVNAPRYRPTGRPHSRPERRNKSSKAPVTTAVKAAAVDSTTEDDSGVKKEKRRDRRRRNYRGRIEQGTKKVVPEAPLVGA
ncbi:conserved hypothetical protein [Perkinsus marinus ATCC 50983]|uniref:DNA/RNA-binding protein Alba-like domain-containing protein n=2 Tax=Perkinsus marinus (strain ATCC 50983 / TXsc) TaxID=423536 RepID=C5LF29_PERM5|nr:conserved hypothetical protein [Perkinsus marinus ATCC 50983]EER04667.1 conserved hypothetical protein [Perkinsus marinus ATCC 50983]|eukprot:XP_002772851.1 conserved hypothetical protein [Perkinsus marinus ATCC 50983]